MRAIYDKEADVLRIIGEQPVADTASLARGPDAAVDLATFNGHDVTGISVVGASAYLPLNLGYDVENDVLTIGETTDDPTLVTENGDFVGFWEVIEDEPSGFHDPIGVAIRRASVHLAKVIAKLPQPSDITNA